MSTRNITLQRTASHTLMGILFKARWKLRLFSAIFI